MLEEIIQGCRQRHRKSQEKLYEKFYGYGMSITLRYCGSREQAVEILNDGFMKVFTNIQAYDPDRPFKPWLRRIIINTAINHFHKTKNIPRWEELEAAKNGMIKDETITSTISYREIIGMIQQLPPAYRTVFNLHVIEGFKHNEIAQILGIAVGTSKSNLAKAKKSLQSTLEKSFT